jgi:hypothetical protein
VTAALPRARQQLLRTPQVLMGVLALASLAIAWSCALLS